ncbi:hypothetical protein [Nonlabens sp.]|uniref:hypothetical protein n=1 Tax=Nonlabens sp. TaxID=1888209 RepID=UPI003F6A2DD3
MMRFTILLVIMLCATATSCLTQEQQEQEAQSRAQLRLQSIDFTAPDQLPLFEGCDELENVEICFYKKLYEQVELRLNNHHLQFEVTKTDSLTAIIRVDKNGFIKYDGLSGHTFSDKDIMVDSLLKNELQDMDQIKPALKQGVPVNSAYLLPVIIKPATAPPADSSK